MDSLSFSQADLGTQGEGPCFMVPNSQVEESQEVTAAMKMTNIGVAGPNKRRMLWDLTALRGSQPSPVLTTGGINGKGSDEAIDGKFAGEARGFRGRTLTGLQCADGPHQAGSSHPVNQADHGQGNAAGDGGSDGGNGEQDAAAGAGGAAAGGGGEDGSGGGDEGGGGQDGEEEDDDDEEDESGEETSQDTSNHSSVPKLVSPPALSPPPRTVRVREVVGGAEAAISPAPAQSDDDPAGGDSGRGGGVSDAPTAIAGDSTDAVASPSPPRALLQRDSEEKASVSGLMDPPTHSLPLRKKSSETSHSSSSSLSSRSSNSSSYHASLDSSSSRALSSLHNSSLSSGDGVQATSLMFTQIKEHSPKTVEHQLPSLQVESTGLEGESLGRGENTEAYHPLSSQQDLFSDTMEERRADYYQPHLYQQYNRVRVLANETSTSDDASITVVPPSPDAYKNGIQETPPDRIVPADEDHHSEGPSSLHQQGDRILVNETSTSDDASITIVHPSPEAWGTIIANTPPEKIEQYSRSTISSAKRDSDRTPSTPSETLGSLHLSGQQGLSGSEESMSIVPPTFDAYGPIIPQLTPSTPTPLDEEEPMELSFQEESEQVATTTHPPKQPRSGVSEDDEYKIPEWQQALNQQQQQAAMSRSSSNSSSSTSTSSSSKTTTSSSQSSEPSGRVSAKNLESFQAWQPSSQQTATSTSSAEPFRSRPASTQAKLTRQESDKRRGGQDISEGHEKPRPVSEVGRPITREVQDAKSISQPSTGIMATFPKPRPERSFQRVYKPPTTSGAIPEQHPDIPARRSGDERPPEAETSRPTAGNTSSSSQEMRRGEGATRASRSDLSDEWMLHYTPTQTETEPEPMEEGRDGGKGRAGGAWKPASSRVLVPHQPSQASSLRPHHLEALPAISTTRETAHTATSRTDTAASSTSASSSGTNKSKDLDNQREGGRGIQVPSSDVRGRHESKTDPKQGLVAPGAESQSVDPNEYSSIAFHLSLPRDGGFRPAGDATQPQKQRSSSHRGPISHSTPRTEQSPEHRQSGQQKQKPGPKPSDQVETPKLTRTSTLTLGADIEADPLEGTQTPVFQLERPSDAAELLKAAQESPSKKSTSVFAKVQETKKAASEAKNRGHTSDAVTTKSRQREDPFAFSQARPTSQQHTEDASVDPGKQVKEEDDEETIPVHYQEDEPEASGDILGRSMETDRPPAIGSKTLIPEFESHLQEEGKKKLSERTPDKGKRDKPISPSSASRLTRSGQKRKLPDKQSEEGVRKRGGAAKKTRFEEAEPREPRVTPSGKRDPYDFSDSQSNKMPSPMKTDSRKGAVEPLAASGPRKQGLVTEDQKSAVVKQKEPPVQGVTAKTGKSGVTTRRQEKEVSKDATSPAQQKTPPIAEVLKAARSVTAPTRATPKTGKHLGKKSAPTIRPPSARGRRAASGRQRSASLHILEAQQEEDSSPDFQPDQPREKAGVKFRKSPRKKASQKPESAAETPTANDPPPPRKHIIRRTVVYRVVVEEIIIDGKLVKTWETREQIEPIVETVEDEDSLDLPSPTRSISSLTSGSLADLSSMYSKTSSSTPSLARTWSGSGGTLSKHSSFSSISRPGSSLSKHTVSSPGSDKSTPTLNKSTSSPGLDKSPGKEKSNEVMRSPLVGGSSSPRRVSFTRRSSKTSLITRVSSSSGEKETLQQTEQISKEVYEKPQQTGKGKVDQQQSFDIAERLSSPDVDPTVSPEEQTSRQGQLSAVEVAKLVQLSQGKGRPSGVSPESASPPALPISHLPGRRSSRTISPAQSGQDKDERKAMPRTHSTPARVTTHLTKSPTPSPGDEGVRTTRSSKSKQKEAESETPSPQVDKVTPVEPKTSSMRSPLRSPSMRRKQSQQPVSSVDLGSEPQGIPTPRQFSRRASGKESTPVSVSKEAKIQEEATISSESTPRSSKDKARATGKKTTATPLHPASPPTPPQQVVRPMTSEQSLSFPQDTLFEPPAGETLPVTEGEVALLLPELKVYTKWLDGFWYPGTIGHQDKVSRYVIKFDDGDHRTVNERDIIIKEWLSRGQTVMAEGTDGFYYPGIIVGYYRDPESNHSGYVIEQTVSHETSRYERRRVILNKDQAASLISSTSSSSSNMSGNNISLDNIVYSKRTRLRSRLLDSPGSVGEEKPQMPLPSRQGVKRKLVPSDEQQRKDTPSPLLRKRGRPAARAPATVITPSPDTTISPRRSPRKHQQQQQQQQGEETHPMAAHMGPIPTQPNLFLNHAFLVTHGEIRKPPLQVKSSSSDESSAEDETEVVPFDRNYAMEQILRGGGVVLSDFDKSQITKLKVLLISNTYCRTKKYFQALAAGIPCVSHLWLRQCCLSGRLENHRSYLLPAGESLEDNALMEIQPNRSILAGMSVYMTSDYEGVQGTWRSILIAAGCKMVSKLPTHLELSKNPDLSLDCNVIVTDPSCPRSLLHRASQLDIPVVSCEWIIQCLINGVRVPYSGHERYTWNYKEKVTR